MDEQQSNFKVTDRRLFNADGTPREVPPEEQPVREPEKKESTATHTSTAAAETEAAAADEEKHLDQEPTPEEVAAARDPASFLNFLMSIASNAASSLGMMDHPVTHQREVDLELGKHWIDVLGMLEKKTQGNLTAQEKQMLEGLLSDLRMQFVSLSNSTKARSFSGSDITGGR